MGRLARGPKGLDRAHRPRPAQAGGPPPDPGRAVMAGEASCCGFYCPQADSKAIIQNACSANISVSVSYTMRSFRLEPSLEQEAVFREWVGCARLVWNLALEQRMVAWDLNKHRT